MLGTDTPMNNYSNVKTPFGNPLVTDKDGQTALNVQLELLTQTNRLLENVRELTPIYGAERVLEFMQLGGLFRLHQIPNLLVLLDQILNHKKAAV
jgi:hypothetical protein